MPSLAVDRTDVDARLRGSSRPIRPRGRMRVFLLAILITLELLGLGALAIGPSRFERDARIALAEAAFRALSSAGYLAASFASAPGAPVLPFDALVRSADESGAVAATYFAPDVFTYTWLGDFAYGMVDHPASLSRWVTHVGRFLTIQREWVGHAGDETVEIIWGRSRDLEDVGIGAYRLVYVITSQDGHITHIAAFFDPLVAARAATLSPQIKLPRAYVGEALALVALILPAVVGVSFLVSARRRPGIVGVALTLVIVIVLVGASLGDPTPNELGDVLPDSVLYVAHAGMGAALNVAGAPARLAALQWTKAASHARTPAEETEAARGISAARARSLNPRELDALLCTVASHGSPRVIGAIEAAHSGCG